MDNRTDQEDEGDSAEVTAVHHELKEKRVRLKVFLHHKTPKKVGIVTKSLYRSNLNRCWQQSSTLNPLDIRSLGVFESVQRDLEPRVDTKELSLRMYKSQKKTEICENRPKMDQTSE